MFRSSRIELLIFAATFLSFAYFNQGGGWNQNARFAEVRSMTEGGRFPIDDFLVYQRDDARDDLVRLPVTDAEYTLDGQRFRLCWVDMGWTLYPVGEKPLGEGTERAPMIEVCSSGDISYVPQTGHFHPNKPPGTSFFAVPGYWLVYHIEKAMGLSPDHWWILDVNMWLASVLSVGLISSIGCVLFYRIAKEMAGSELPALLATFSLAFGTTFFPFATLLFDHNLTASFLIATLYFLRAPGGGALGAGHCAAAGLSAGCAAITNYVAAVMVVVFGFYLLWKASRQTRWRCAASYTAGVIPPFLLICWYGLVCFGSPFKLNNDFQNPLFQDASNALGMFGAPDLRIAKLLLFSPFRGILFFCPVLLGGLYGLGKWIWKRQFLPEALLCLSVFGLFFLVNASFNGYHAGYSAGPRYLVPGIPFLALPLIAAFQDFRWLTGILAAVSMAMQLLLTATDAQNPVGVGGHAQVEGRPEEGYNLITNYALPLFLSGKAWPLLDAQVDLQMDEERERIASATPDPAERAEMEAESRSALLGSIQQGAALPLALGSLTGPVSVNPIGAFEGLFTYGYFPPDSEQCEWASFNIGELFWPQSRLSLLPLLLAVGGCGLWATRLAQRNQKNGAVPAKDHATTDEETVRRILAE